MKIGFSRCDITPNGKIGIAGNIPSRPTDKIFTKLYATAMVIEENGVLTAWVSLDMCHPTRILFEEIGDVLENNIVGFDRKNLIINATHATALCFVSEEFFVSAEDGIMNEIIPLDVLRKQICDGVLNAVKGAVSSLEECILGLSFSETVTGFCRRVVYTDGSCVMYGNPNREDFLRMEYPDGTEIQILYFYNKATNKLKGIFCAVPCPAQADEVELHITADYWDTVRKRLYKEYGDDVNIVTLCRFAGELSPHKIIRPFGKYEEETYGARVAESLGNRIADAIIEKQKNHINTYDLTKETFENLRLDIDFPIRQPSKKEIESAKEFCKEYKTFDDETKYKRRVRDFEAREILKVDSLEEKTYNAPCNILKIGDIIIFTAPCEMFCEYAKLIQTQFKDLCLIDVELCNDCMGYIPTKEAIEKGGYSTGIMSCITDHTGGEIYVNEIKKVISKIT